MARWSELLSPRRVAASARRLAALAWVDRRVKALVILLILGDLLAMLLHIGHRLNTHGIFAFDALLDPGFYMKYGSSYAAHYGFVMLGAIALTSVWLFATSHQAVYAGIGLAFLTVLTNAVFGLHVIMGDWVDETLGLQAIYHEYANYVGEAISFAVIGCAAFAILLWTCERSTLDHGIVGILVALTLAALSLFDGALDLANALNLSKSDWLSETLVFIEESGELLAITATLVILTTVAIAQRADG